jgi:hypothetical protein
MLGDLVLTTVELENLFQNLVASILGVDPDSDVRVEYMDTGSPGFTQTDDVCFVHVDYESTPYFVTETKYSALNNTQVNQLSARTNNVQLLLTFYGPNGLDRAHFIKDVIRYQENHDILALQGVFLIAEAYKPVHFHEIWPDQSGWWERSDLRLHFNCLVERNVAVTAIEDVPLVVEHNLGEITQTDILAKE